MTTTLKIDGLQFDRQTILNLADAIDEVIWDRFDEAFSDLASNSIGEQKADETEDDFNERFMEAMSAARYLALQAIVGNSDQYETL